jgi:signal transduction histidine kinase/ActR/RegA family two-component response regulator
MNEQGNEQRVLVVAPVGRDASLICDLLTRQGVGCESCNNVPELASKIGERTGALLIIDEALRGGIGLLLDVLNVQPQWSDVPLILLTTCDNATRTKKLIDQNWAGRRNVIVVDRPVRRVALTTAVLAALQNRTHHYQIRDHLEAEKRKDDQLRQSQRLESIGILAGGVAHDFNNMLMGILGNASLILNDIPTGHPARDRAQGICEAAQRAAELTRQLLAYSGKGKFIVEPIDLSSLVRDMSQLIGLSIPKSVFLQLDLNKALPAIEADSSQIQQVIMNLVINGAEAIGTDKQGTVQVHTAVQDLDSEYIERTFTPGEIEPGPYVLLEVQDTGCGMDESTVARIFDPFFTTKFTGRGLGLAAVRGIVRGHRGALRVYSTPGQGTTFKVLFPATEKVCAKPRSPIESAGQRGSGTILVVDDEDVVRKIAKNALEQAGYTVLLAESGQAAIDLLKTAGEQVSLVLLDMTMPGLNGHETFLQLKRVRPKVKVLLSSGYNELEATRRFSGQGLAGFIPKPYTAGTLSKTVNSVLLSMDEHGPK